MQRTALIPHYRINSGTTPDIRSAIGTALGGAIIDFIQTDSIHICTVLTAMSSQITDGFNWSIHSIYTTPALAATLSNIIDGLSFPSTLRDPRSQEHQSTIIGGLLFPSMHRWKKKRPMISSSSGTSSLPPRASSARRSDETQGRLKGSSAEETHVGQTINQDIDGLARGTSTCHNPD
jgi:hypothetical protein